MALGAGDCDLGKRGIWKERALRLAGSVMQSRTFSQEKAAKADRVRSSARRGRVP